MRWEVGSWEDRMEVMRRKLKSGKAAAAAVVAAAAAVAVDLTTIGHD